VTGKVADHETPPLHNIFPNALFRPIWYALSYSRLSRCFCWVECSSTVAASSSKSQTLDTQRTSRSLFPGLLAASCVCIHQQEDEQQHYEEYQEHVLYSPVPAAVRLWSH